MESGGYVGLYISKYGISPNKVTLTLLRSAKPVKMFKEMTQFADADETKGIYHIRNWKVDFSIQAIVSRELEGKERRIPRNNEKSKAGKHPADNGRDKRNHGPDPSRLVSRFHGTAVKAG